MTLKTDTELSAVNSILGAIGQAPVTSINASNPQTAMVSRILDETILEVLTEGWHFNVEDHYELVPNVNNEILISEDMLRVDIHDDHIYRSEDIVRRNGKLIMRLAAKTAKSTKETAPRCAAGTPATGQTHHT